MKKIVAGSIALAAFVGATAFTIQAVMNWKIDSEKAMVKFSLTAHGQELIGNFKGATGEVKFDENDPANSSLRCNIDMSTINTGIGSRDKHLQAKGFFDAAATPFSTFTSTKMERMKEGYLVTGNLHMKETTQAISIQMIFNGAGADAGTFTGSFFIKRSDYKIGEVDDEISDDVKISFEIPVTKIN